MNPNGNSPTKSDYRKLAVFAVILVVAGGAAIALGANLDNTRGIILIGLGVVMLVCVAVLGVATARRRRDRTIGGS